MSEVTERVTRKNKNNESTRPLTISAQDGLIDQNDFFDKQVASRDVSGYYLVKNGEFAYNKSYSNGYPWGAIKRLDHYDMGVLSTLYIVFKPTNVSSQFLVSYYDTTKWYKEVAKNAAEGARNHGLLNIAPSDFFSTVLEIPASIEEQDKIGDFLKKMDNLIAANQRKIDDLKALKNAYLERIFTQSLRFSGYTEPWVQRKFFDNVKNVIDFRGRTPLKLGMDWSDSGYLALSALNVKNGYIDANRDAHYGGEELYQKWMGNVKLVKGDVLFTTEAPMGNVAQVPDDKGYILSQRTIALQTDEDVTDSTFFAQYLRSPQIQNTLNSVSSGGTAKGVSQKTLTPIRTVVPGNVREQKKIGEILVAMDNLITANQKKIDLMQKQKQAYLQKMFI